MTGKGRPARVLMSVELDGLPPTVNHLYRSTRGGRRYKTKDGREWQNATALAMRAAKKDRAPWSGGAAMDVLFISADRRRWDIDNRIKALQDCLAEAGVLKDDKQIIDLRARREYGRADRTLVTVSEAGGQGEIEWEGER